MPAGHNLHLLQVRFEVHAILANQGIVFALLKVRVNTGIQTEWFIPSLRNRLSVYERKGTTGEPIVCMKHLHINYSYTLSKRNTRTTRKCNVYNIEFLKIKIKSVIKNWFSHFSIKI